MAEAYISIDQLYLPFKISTPGYLSLGYEPDTGLLRVVWDESHMRAVQFPSYQTLGRVAKDRRQFSPPPFFTLLIKVSKTYRLPLASPPISLLSPGTLPP